MGSALCTFEHNQGNIMIPDRYTYKRFYIVCKYGSLKQIRSFVTRHDIYLSYDNNTPFAIVCNEGRLNVAMWMYHKVTNGLNLHINTIELAKQIILYSPIHVVGWITTLNIFDYRAENDNIFHRLCLMNNVVVAKYFEKICKDFRIETAVKHSVNIAEYDDESNVPHNQLTIVNYHILRNHRNELEFTRKIGMGTDADIKKLINVECPSCLDPLNNGFIILECNHGICVQCFYAWYYEMKKYSLCQICKRKFFYNECKCRFV